MKALSQNSRPTVTQTSRAFKVVYLMHNQVHTARMRAVNSVAFAHTVAELRKSTDVIVLTAEEIVNV